MTFFVDRVTKRLLVINPRDQIVDESIKLGRDD